MKKFLSSTPVLGFLFLFNSGVAVAAPFMLEGNQQIATSAGMAVVALGAGIALVQKFRSPKPVMALSAA